MQWHDHRDGEWLVNDDGKVMGRVTQAPGSSIYHAEAIYAGGGAHKNSLGDYISIAYAKAAVENHVRDVLLPRES